MIVPIQVKQPLVGDQMLIECLQTHVQNQRASY